MTLRVSEHEKVIVATTGIRWFWPSHLVAFILEFQSRIFGSGPTQRDWSFRIYIHNLMPLPGPSSSSRLTYSSSGTAFLLLRP
jgi:hypothetical protein